MTIKRIIMDIDESLHKKLKDYAIKDDRTLNSAIKRVLAAGIDIVDNDHPASNNSSNVVKDTDVIQNNTNQYSDDNISNDIKKHEITMHSRWLTPDEREYLATNPFTDLNDYENEKSK